MKLSKDKILKKSIAFFNNETYFRFTFLSLLYFSVLCVAGFYFYVAACISLIWGAYLFGYKMIYKGFIKNIRYRILIYFFLGTSAVTSFLHWQDNLIPNLFIVGWMTICFFIFMGMSSSKSSKNCRNEAEIFMKFIFSATTVIMIFGIILLCFFPKGFEFCGDKFCIYENRFVGIIYNANITAFYAVTAVVLCLLVCGIMKSEGNLNTKRKAYYIFCGIVNAIALFLSDSNGSLLFLIVFICFLIFYIIYKDYKKGFFNFLVRTAVLGIACIAVAASLLGIRTLVQNGTSNLLKLSEPSAEISTNVTVKNNQVHIAEDIDKHNDNKSTTFKHQNTNLDSGRFVIWRQSLQLFEKFPVMGIGKANIEIYGERYMGGLKYADFHNGLITIIISFGLVGFNIFMVLAITIAKNLLKGIFRYQKECRKDGWVPVIIVSFCAAYCVYSMLEIALLVDLSYKVFIFWFIIGLGLSYTSKYEYHSIITNKNLPKRTSDLYRFVHTYNCKKT